MSRMLEPCYPTQLRQAISQFLPHRGLSLLSEDGRVRWTDRLLVVCAVLTAWSPMHTLKDRFQWAREATAGMYPTRRRPGASYEGFIAALCAASARLLAVVCAALRAGVKDLAGGHWEVCGWAVFGCDSSKIDCPMTEANEKELGCASRSKSWPQQLLTTIFHTGTGLPWAFVRGVATAGERAHLLQMLELLPKGAMLLADAGFTGYDLLKAVIDSGRSFVIRVGSNVRLLTKLGYCLREHDGIVYLWPDKHKKKGLPPLVLRLVKFTDARNRTVCLLTNILDPNILPDSAVLSMYRLRWGVELLFRSLKQTLGRRKMLSDSPAHARAELDWSLVGLWLLGMMSVKEACGAGEEPGRWSPALALRAVRRAAAAGPSRVRTTLSSQLADAVKDQYRRTREKKSRHWPHKKRSNPPGQPKARTATEQEIQSAQELRSHNVAA